MTGRHSGNDKQKTTLLVGSDSAWTAGNSGGLVGVLCSDDGTFHELGPPQIVDYPQAQAFIAKWQAELVPTATLILLDQPTNHLSGSNEPLLEAGGRRKEVHEEVAAIDVSDRGSGQAGRRTSDRGDPASTSRGNQKPMGAGWLLRCVASLPGA